MYYLVKVDHNGMAV